MRNILFKGKRKDNNEWVYGGLVHQTDFYGDKCDRWFIIDGTDTKDYDIGYENEVYPESVGEFTGLYDKNNVRIFEGDIVRLTSKYPQSTWIATVEFGNPNNRYSWGFDLKYVSGDSGFYTDILMWVYGQTGESCEVIGNVYDNKKLLKGEK